MSYSQSAAHFFEIINKRDFDQMRSHLTEDARLLFPKTQPLIGRERILKFFQVLFHRYPALIFSVEGTIAEGDKVAVHWKNSGINKRREPYDNEGVTLFHFEGGKVVFMSDFFKDTGKF